MLHDSVARVYGSDCYLFGVDLSDQEFNQLGDEVGIGPYERNLSVMWDGVQIAPGRNLEVGRIDVVIAQPGNLLVRPELLQPEHIAQESKQSD